LQLLNAPWPPPVLSGKPKTGTVIAIGPKESFGTLMRLRIQAELHEQRSVQVCQIQGEASEGEAEALKRAGFYKADIGKLGPLQGLGFIQASSGDFRDEGSKRYKALYSSLQVQARGSSLFAQIQGPDTLDLGADLPLTLMLQGVQPGDVLRVRCDNATPKRLPDYAGQYCFALPSGRGKAATTALGKGLGLSAILSNSQAGLRLRLRNESKQEIKKIRVTFRIEVPVEPGLIKHWAGDLDPGLERDIEVPLKDAENACATAQIDAWKEGRLWRDYAGCGAPN
jgi:hypothetical protein